MQCYVDNKKKAYEFRVIMVWAIILCLFNAQLTAEALGLEKNLYRYPQYKDSPHRSYYLEHWYFNFQTKDIQGIITYEVYPAAKVDEICSVSAIFFVNKNNKIIKSYKRFTKEHFKFHKSQLSIGHCKIIFKEKSIKIQGKLNEEGIWWNLEYIPTKDHFYLFRDQPIGLFKWESYNTLVYIHAKVCGTVKVSEQQSFQISGSGCHEHGFGHLLLGWNVRNHLQVNTDKLQLVFMQINSLLKEKAQLTLSHQNRILSFTSVKVKNLRILIEENIKEVIKFFIQAQKDDYYVELVAERIHSHPIHIKNPQIGPDLTILQAYVKVKGKLTYKGGVLVEFEGEGFYESAARNWLSLIDRIVPFVKFH